MKLKQLSVFLENKPGQLGTPCRVLAEAGINIVTLSLADTQQFGILRLIIGTWRKAKDVLEKAGCVVNVTEVVAIKVPDRPGGLAGVLRIIEEAKINIEYIYASTDRLENAGIIVFRFEDPDGAIKALQAKGIDVVDGVRVYHQEM